MKILKILSPFALILLFSLQLKSQVIWHHRMVSQSCEITATNTCGDSICLPGKEIVCRLAISMFVMCRPKLCTVNGRALK